MIYVSDLLPVSCTSPHNLKVSSVRTFVCLTHCYILWSFDSSQTVQFVEKWTESNSDCDASLLFEPIFSLSLLYVYVQIHITRVHCHRPASVLFGPCLTGLKCILVIKLNKPTGKEERTELQIFPCVSLGWNSLCNVNLSGNGLCVPALGTDELVACPGRSRMMRVDRLHLAFFLWRELAASDAEIWGWDNWRNSQGACCSWRLQPTQG